MAEDQIKRFERWRRDLPDKAADLVTLVLEQIVPDFRGAGLERFGDYAGGSSFAVGPNCIPLQRRSGSEWPTVEIQFDKRQRPVLGVVFARLPEVCMRHAEAGTTKIPRLDANVVEGPVFFTLCKGEGRSLDCNFGYHGFVLRPQHKLREEIAALKSLLPWLLRILDEGIPEEWTKKQPGYVDRHAFLSRAANIFRQGR
jgi:hypothetical protein